VKRPFLGAAAVLLLTGAFGLITPLEVQAVDFSTLIQRLDQTPAVRQEWANLQIARRNLSSLEFPGSPSIGVTPEVRTTTADGGDYAEQIDLTGSLSLRFPVGLSDIGRERVRTAMAELQVAEEAYARARESAWLDLLTLYQTAYLTQEEERVLRDELQAAQATEGALRRQLEAGEIAVVDLSRAETDLREAEEATATLALERRLSWIELALTTGLTLGPETPQLDPPPLQPGELPPPPQLAIWASDHDVAVNAQRVKVETLEATISRLQKVDLTTSVRAFLSGEDHSASLGYDFENPEVSGSWSFPLATYGDVPTSGSGGTTTDTWASGISVTLSYRSGKQDNLLAQSTEASLEQERIRLETVLTSMEIAVRGRYQQWLRATTTVEQAARALQRSVENQEIVAAKERLGLVGDYEVLASQAAVERARWALMAAEMEETRARLAAADSASYLGQMIDVPKGEE